MSKDHFVVRIYDIRQQLKYRFEHFPDSSKEAEYGCPECCKWVVDQHINDPGSTPLPFSYRIEVDNTDVLARSLGYEIRATWITVHGRCPECKATFKDNFDAGINERRWEPSAMDRAEFAAVMAPFQRQGGPGCEYPEGHKHG